MRNITTVNCNALVCKFLTDTIKGLSWITANIDPDGFNRYNFVIHSLFELCLPRLFQNVHSEIFLTIV